MRIETVRLTDLTPDPANARRHSRRNLDAIKSSLRRFGQQRPIIVDASNVIVAGNGTFEAARDLGWESIDVYRTDLSGAEAVAFAIADNRTAELAEWDCDVLARSLEGLGQVDNLNELVTGFDAGEIEKVIRSLHAGEDQAVEEDEPPSLPVDPVTRPGDLWLLGDHRLLCGDCRDPIALARLFDGLRADCLLTDPPYGVSYRGKTPQALTIENDAADGLEGFLRASIGGALEHCRDGATMFCFAPAGPQIVEFGVVLREIGVLRQTLIWDKTTMVLGHSDYHFEHETLFYGWRPGAPHCEPLDRKQTTIWRIPKPAANTQHPTSKPVALVAKAIANGSIRDAVVFAPFVGSGTTIIACEQLDRRAFAIDVDPRYVDVAVRRWEELTGKEARREE